MQECRYGRALALYAAAELEQAGRAFEALGAYKDAESYARSCAARLDPMSWLQNLIRERGELSTPEGELGSLSYFYELGAPISGPDINESKLELRWFPDADETRLALIKVEPFGETTLSTYANLYFSGEMTVTLFVGNMPTMWTTVRVDPASYTAGGDYEIEQHKHMILRKDPNESYRSELSDMLDSCLELAAQFLEGEAEGVTLADFGFTSYQVDPERVSPLLSGEKTDSRILL